MLLEEAEAFDVELMEEKEAETKAEVERTQPAPTMFTDESQMEDGATGYRWCGRPDRPGRASCATWATPRKPTIRSALLFHGYWNGYQEDMSRTG